MPSLRPALALAALMATGAPASATERPPLDVVFRDLFNEHGKPSDHAVTLDGQRVVMIGFAADPPTEDSPFMVFVGAPTVQCPYCFSIDEREHPPYVLVYPTEAVKMFDYNDRIRVEGVLQASHGYDPEFGIHNDIRMLEATVVLDERQGRAPAPLPEGFVLPDFDAPAKPPSE